MKAKENQKDVRGKSAAERLLLSRAKEIKALREDIAGWQESVRLASAFTALLALAVSGDPAAATGVHVQKAENAYTVLVEKQALREALAAWQVESLAEGEQYRIVFRREEATA